MQQAARKANNCSCARESSAAHPRWNLPGLSCSGVSQARNPETRTINRVCCSQHAKRAEPEGPTPKTRTNPDASSPKARIPTPKVLASPRKRCYLPDYGFIRYLLLYLPPLLQLALRSSSYALPYAETLQAFQALAPDPSALHLHA